MAEISIEEVRQYLEPLQGREVELDKLRRDFGITQEAKSWVGIRKIMFRLTEQKFVKASGRRDGIYKVIKRVQPIRVFGTNHKSAPFDLVFPRDFDTGMEFALAEHIIVRSGDLILIAGVSNYGKTALAMQFLAENIDTGVVLMGNEYTGSEGKPQPRFLNRLEAMDWVEWVDADGEDRFTLLPVMEDYAENIVKDKINIVDWINIETGEHYMINNIMKDMKNAVGNGVVIAVIQKAETSEAGRGGQFTKDFADVELLIDKHSEYESRLTVGKVKEYNKSVTGHSWAYEITKGVKLHNVREVVKCPECHGFPFRKGKPPCENCRHKGWVNL